MEIPVYFPFPEVFRCPHCFNTEAGRVRRIVGEYRSHTDLTKHVKRHHPDDVIVFRCATCSWAGSGRYPLKTVKLHVEAKCCRPGRGTCAVGRRPSGASAAGSSPRDGSTGVGVSVTPPATTVVLSPHTGGATTTSLNFNSNVVLGTTSAERLLAPIIAVATAPSTARPLATTYAAVTASQGARVTTAVAARPATSRAATLPRRPPGAAKAKVKAPPAPIRRSGPRAHAPPANSPPTTGRPSAEGAALRRSGGNTTSPPQQAQRRPSAPRVSGGRSSGTEHRTPPQRRDSAPRDSGGRRSGEGKRLPPRAPPTNTTAEPGILTRARRAASVPVNVRPATGVATRRSTRTRPLPTGPEQGTRRRSRRTPSSPTSTTPGSSSSSSSSEASSSPAQPIRAGKRGARGVAARGKTSTATTGVGRGRRPLSRAVSLPPGEASRPSPPPRETARPVTPTTWVTTAAAVISPRPPTTTGAATLTTATVTTTCCGGPVVSIRSSATGRGKRGGIATPPSTLPVIREIVTLRAANSRAGTTANQRGIMPGSPGGQEEGHVEEEEEEPWHVVAGRRARRSPPQQTPPRTPPRTPAGSSTPSSSRLAPTPPPVTEANYPPLASSRRRGRTGGATERRGNDAAKDGGSAATTGGGSKTPACSACPGVTPMQMAPEPTAEGGTLRGPASGSVTSDCVGLSGGHGALGVETASAPLRPPPRTRPQRPANGRPVLRGNAGSTSQGGPRSGRTEAFREREALIRLAETVALHHDLEELATKVNSFFQASKGSSVPPTRGNTEGRTGPSAARPQRRPEARPVNPERASSNREDRPAPSFGEGRRYLVREATRLQRLFRLNRSRAVREVLKGSSPFCQVQKEEVQRYFEEVHGGRNAEFGPSPVRPSGAPEVGTESLVRPFEEREVDRRIRRMNNSAPGPDGLTYADLRKADPGSRLLTAVFNACYRMESIPATWKTSNTILVYKKGDQADLSNWRPLALGDTTAKLMAALLADRLTDWAVLNQKISPAQKGFLQHEGCYEHNYVLQEILADARRPRNQAVIAWLDLSNAFGSIPHAVIRRALDRAGVPSRLLNIWKAMYNGCTTRVRTAEGYTDPIPIRSGVRQGCPLSPITFNLAIESVVRRAAEESAGYTLHGRRYNILAYADDLALIADTPEGMRELLKAVEMEAESIGLRFNPAKCATLHVGRSGGGVLPTRFHVQGEPVRALAAGEPYEHLGVPTGIQVRQTPITTLEELVACIRAVDESLLAPWQKLETVAVFLLPRLDFLLRGAHVEKGPLKEVDKLVKRLAKSWMNLPQRASAELVFIPPSRGGGGLLPLADLADALTVAHAFRLLSASDEAVRELAWDSLRQVTRRKIGGPPSNSDLAAYLSGSLEGRLARDAGDTRSLWSRARNAARRQADRLGLRWRWADELNELALECRGMGGRRVVVTPRSRAQVVSRVRTAVSEWYLYTLLVKRDQGKAIEASSRTNWSNHFCRGGKFTRFADWRFIHRARLNVLPLNGARRWGEGDKRCRRCGADLETLPHVLGHCGVHSAAIQYRHNAILSRLRVACRLPGQVRVNQRVEGVDHGLEALRPDLVIRHEASKSVVIVDVTVPFENRLEAFIEARERKVAKYAPLAESLERRGYRVAVNALVVGSLGSWDPRNEAVLSLLRVSRRYATMMRRFMVSDAIRWSRDIYVEHVSGVRQYVAPPSGGDVADPDTPLRSNASESPRTRPAREDTRDPLGECE